MNNIDVCLKNVGSQGSFSPEQRTSQNLEQLHSIEGENLECLSNDGNDVDKINQYILSVKKDNKAADSLYHRNGIDSVKEDSMTKALKKAMSENFHDNEEHPQTLFYKNLWLEAEAALCASNLRARFNSARSGMEKHESPKNKPKIVTKHLSLMLLLVQTPLGNWHLRLRCPEDAARHKDVGNSVLSSDFEVSVKQDVAEKLGLDKKKTAVTCIEDIDSSFPTSKMKGLWECSSIHFAHRDWEQPYR
ncbi:uncharacterized protein LOC103501179 isoform X2 [Cucumis melo]|uniref:Uncharacterized protein LOC103501179 isoform X2 n=1 Tax=Cucumis melo TaxID=3656 RepID=A0ABM3L0A0_CUCME|nr:uncharacterized protein LOC103501179 isoform X2 [Cucumis melo]